MKVKLDGKTSMENFLVPKKHSKWNSRMGNC